MTAPAKLTDQDFITASKRLRCDVSAIRAVAEIESRGGGFLFDDVDNEYKPKILFERHIMYRRYKDKHGYDKAIAMVNKYPDVINTASGGYIGGEEEHRRLKKARNIDNAIALESASWGMFQIMGFHWQALGYTSAVDFVLALSKDEASQLEAFVRFIEVNKSLLNAIRAKDWNLFAQNYNGKDYRKNNYHVKLAQANAKYLPLNQTLNA